MSGLQNTMKRTLSFSKGSGYETHQESDIRRGGPKKRADKLYSTAALPDEDDLSRQAKRRQARRRGSRASTILTDQDTLG